MAIGDIAGDIQNTYGQGLTPEQRAARQAALTGASGQSSLATSPISAPPAGPIGRAQQQLPNAGLGSSNLGVPGQDDAKQTSFDATNTPSNNLPPASQPNQAAQPTSLGQINLTPFDPVSAAQQPSSLTDAFKTAPAAQPAVVAPPAQAAATPAQQAPAPLSSLNQANLVTPISQGPQAPPLTNLSQIGTTVGTSLLNFGAQSQPQNQTLGGVVPTATSPTVDPYGIKSVNDQNSLKSANLLASSMPANPLSAPGALLQDQYRPTGIGAGAQGGQIVAQVGPNGEPQFSNIKTDQQSAQGLGQISVSPNMQPTSTQPSTLATAGGIPASAPAPPPDFASLGSAGNLGDGIGAFSQAMPGDAALAAGRFAKANEIYQGTRDQSRLDQALGAQWGADHTTVIHDSSRPVSTAQQQSDIGLQQTRNQAAGDVKTAQGLISANLSNQAGEQQLRQASRLEDLQVAATASGATAVDQQNYLRAKDPAGYMKLQLAAPQAAATLAKTQADTRKLEKGNIALPSTLQKLEDDDLENIGNVGGINSQLQHFTDQITSGKLNLSPTQNLDSVVNHATGGTDENSRNYAAFKAGLVKLTNDSLRLNKGTQTEGDAQRASDELLDNLKDPGFVLQRLGELQGLNTKAAGVRTGVLNSRRKSQGIAPLDINSALGIAPAPQLQTTKPQVAVAASSAQTASPRPGQVEDGHVFLGGNPANPSSWRAQ